MKRNGNTPGLPRVFRLSGAPGGIERDIDDEIEFHLDARTAALMAEGRSAADARATAEREYGDIPRSRDELAHVDHGRMSRERRADWRDAFAQDIRQAARSLARAPTFSLSVIIMLALAIGANAAMFGVVDRLLLRGPNHVRDAGQLRRVVVAMNYSNSSVVSRQGSLGYPNYLDLASTKGITAIAAYSSGDAMLGSGDHAQSVAIGYVTPAFFPLTGVSPVLGRFFSTEEDRAPRGENVALVSSELWRSGFGGNSNVLGAKLELSGVSYTIIGVLPPEFTGVDLQRVDVWLPLSLLGPRYSPEWFTKRDLSWLRIVARLDDGVSPEQAAEAATGIHRAANAAIQTSVAKGRIEFWPLTRNPSGDPRVENSISVWLSGVALIVLVIACANVINLVLARAARRHREIAVRLALGVSRARLMRFLMSEAALLAVVGGVIGVGFAVIGEQLLHRYLLTGISWNVSVDWRLLAFTFVATACCAILIGLVPAYRASRPELVSELKSDASGGRRRWWRLNTVLLVVQPALTVVLLLGAGLFVKSLHRVRNFDLGFEPDRVLVVRFRWPSVPPMSREQTLAERERRRALPAELVERARRNPDIEAAALAIGAPYQGSYGVGIEVPGADSIPSLPRGGPYLASVGAQYFRAMGLRVVAGRGFTDADHAGTEPVVVLESTTARSIWPHEEAVGKCVKISGGPCATVAGVVEDSRRWGLTDDLALQLFVPFGQEVNINAAPTLYIRPRSTDSRTVAGIRRWLADAQTGMPPMQFSMMSAALDAETRPWRTGASMFTLFGALALTVAAFGLYSAIMYIVEQRRRELGIRIALGASSRAVFANTLRRGVGPAVIGLVIGTGAALSLSTLAQPHLFRTSARDVVVYLAVAAIVAAVAFVATLLPALRATRVDPVVALRSD